MGQTKMFQDEKAKKRNKVNHRIVRRKGGPHVELSMDGGPTVYLAYSHNRIHLGRETWADFYVERYVDRTLGRGVTIDDYFDRMQQGWLDQAARMKTKAAEEEADRAASENRDGSFVFFRRPEDPEHCPARAIGFANPWGSSSEREIPVVASGYPTADELDGNFRLGDLEFDITSDPLGVSAGAGKDYEEFACAGGLQTKGPGVPDMVLLSYLHLESLVLDQLKKSRLNKGEWRTHCANDGHIIVPDPIFGRKDFQVPLVLRHVIEAPSMDDPDEVWDIAVVTYVDPNLDTRLVYQMKDLGVDGDPDEVMTAGIIYKDRGVIKYHNLS